MVAAGALLLMAGALSVGVLLMIISEVTDIDAFGLVGEWFLIGELAVIALAAIIAGVSVFIGM